MERRIVNKHEVTKPRGYKNHFVVYEETGVLLIIDLDYTVWQKKLDLGSYTGNTFEVEEKRNKLVITEIEN